MPQATTRTSSKRSTGPGQRSPKKAPGVAGISDAAVVKATGRAWKDWFKVLDRFDVKKNGHKSAAEFIHVSHDCTAWWSQMVVVGYEQARGLRARHQQTDGYSVSASRAIGAPVEDAFAAVTDSKRRRRWLGALRLEPRKHTAGKYARFTCTPGASDSPTSVDFNFYPAGTARCRIAVQHSKLANARDAAKMKAFWAAAADRLRDSLEA